MCPSETRRRESGQFILEVSRPLCWQHIPEERTLQLLLRQPIQKIYVRGKQQYNADRWLQARAEILEVYPTRPNPDAYFQRRYPHPTEARMAVINPLYAL